MIPWGVSEEVVSMAKPTARCILDRNRPCMSCVAPSPAECPYPFLMAESDDSPAPVPASAAG
jgi:hypothetical protein